MRSSPEEFKAFFFHLVERVVQVSIHFIDSFIFPPTLASKKKSLLDDSSSSSDNVSFTRASLLIMAFFKSSGIKRLHSYINFSITLIVWFIVVLLSKFITHLNTYGQGEPCLANFAYNI